VSKYLTFITLVLFMMIAFWLGSFSVRYYQEDLLLIIERQKMLLDIDRPYIEEVDDG